MASGPPSTRGASASPSGLNSCSGEVWPRGPRAQRAREAGVQVSILVLVKYGLGASRRGSAPPPRRGLNSCSGEVWPRGAGRAPGHAIGAEVSILVLVKYGLGDAENGRALLRVMRS